MALLYKFIGDAPNDFELLTDGIPAYNEVGTAVIPDSFHIEEIIGQSKYDVINGMDLIVLETTRTDLTIKASDHGYKLVEFDDKTQLSIINDPPRIINYNPERGQQITAITSNIILTFSENIAKATASGPKVRLINLTDNILVQTFEYDNSAITISNNEITINPTANLLLNKTYAILIDHGYFTNTGVNADHGGIYAQDFYNFTTPIS